MKNKKAEKLFSIWWFFVLGVIAGGIVIGVLIYSSADVNVKEIEANILNERIINCMIDNGYLINLDDFDIFNDCKLDKNVFGKGSDFYFNISVYEGAKLIYNITKGDFTFEKNCRIEKDEDVEAKHFPKCVERKEGALNKNKESLQLIVLTGSNQRGKKEDYNG